MVLAAWCPPAQASESAAASSYPDVPPVVGVTCARLPPAVMVVFTTAHDDHALHAFEVNP